MTAQERQILPVRRPMKRVYLIRSEVSDLTPARTVKRLEPDIVDSVLADRVRNCLAIRRELYPSRSVCMGGDQSRRCRQFQIQKSDAFGNLRASGLVGCVGQHLAVRG